MLNIACSAVLTARSRAATVTAVGMPTATSRAKLGPESAATRPAEPGPASSSSTPAMVSKVASSIPFEAVTRYGAATA